MAQVVAGIVLVTLAVVTTVLFVAAAHRNAQVDALHTRGVPVVVTVTGCLGELGGSGSNAAGYTCRGAFTLGGHRYTEVIPGATLRPPGTTVRAVSVPGDPALLTTATAAARDRATWRVYILPGALAAAFVLLCACVVTLARRGRTAPRSLSRELRPSPTTTPPPPGTDRAP